MSIISYVWNWIILSAFWKKKKREFDPLILQRPRSFRSDDAVDDDVNDAMCGFSSDMSALLSFHSPHRERTTFLLLFTIHFHPHTSSSDRRECVSVEFTLSAHISCVETTEAFNFFPTRKRHIISAGSERESSALGTIWNTLTKTQQAACGSIECRVDDLCFSLSLWHCH